LVILACLTQLTFVTPALAQRAKQSGQERLARVMDPTTDVEEFRQELNDYLTEFEDSLGLFNEIPAVRKKFDQAGLQPLATLAEAKQRLGELSPELLSLMRATYARFPGWREIPQAINSLIKPELRQRIESRGANGKDSGNFAPSVADNCATALAAGTTNSDIAIANGAVFLAQGIMEALPTDAITIAAREASVAAFSLAQAAALTLQTFKNIADDCKNATFESNIQSQITNSTNSIINNSNDNKTAIINNSNDNKTAIIDNANANKTEVITTVNANTQTILDNDNANAAAIKDLILRTQIEADLAAVDSATPVGLYLTPTANGGYLNLVQTIVTQTLANIQAAGGSVATAQPLLNQANAAKTAGDFKGAYALYRKAYKAALK